MKNLVVLPLFLLPLTVSSQEPLTVRYSCNFAAADSLTELYTYEASAEAQEIVERIMEANVLPQNFVLKSSDCNNALATTIGKQRFILYSTAFLENFKKEARTKWAAYSVLAHEIGHHLSNHDLEETSPAVRKRYELEADKFAGGILFRLGASLDEAQAGINTFSLEKDSKTHPPRRARLEALAVGWKQAEDLAGAAASSEGTVAADSDEKKLYQQAVAEKDPLKAIELLDQALEIKEDYADALLERGERRVDVGNDREGRIWFDDALSDFNAYIQMRGKNPVAYARRGYVHRRLDRDSQALADYSRAIRLDPKSGEAYMGRAWVRMKMEEMDGALRDLEKAVQLDPNLAQAHYTHGEIQFGYNEYDKAIADFDKALKADPAFRDALDSRALAKQYAGRFAEAMEDFNRLQQMDPKAFDRYFHRGVCNQSLRKHREAVADFDKALEGNAGFAEAYLHRGVSRQVLGQAAEAKRDFELVFENTVLVINSSVKIGCLLVENGQVKEGLVWLDEVLAESPDNEHAQRCKAAALKK
jgi:tetratricopeptide (TPR) repeat protein